ncbi:MAG: CotH kinase family protein [Bacteroidia bacterium]
MNLRHLIIAFGALCLLFACQEPPPIPIDPGPAFEIKPIVPQGDEKYLNLDSDYVFDQSKLHTFELRVSGPNLAKINADPAAEEYVETMLIFEGDTLSPVGVRYKGSVGAFVNCLSGNDWANPSGYKTCTKLSMKVKINWEGSDTKFFGLKKLQFHSMNLDPTQMRDRLGYWLFREMGVPAPRATHARLVINGVYVGLFSLIEQVDGRFTRYNFKNGKGNLYKEVWPLDAFGNPQASGAYIKALETNEDENPSETIIRSFAQQINLADSTALRNVITNRMKLSEIMAYIAVDRTIRHDDGPFHWYCGGASCSNHNYYWYEDPKEETLHLIPWDLDNAFENIISDVNPVTPLADQWGETRNNCEPFKYGAFQGRQRSAACDKLTAGWVSFTTEYEQALQALKTAPLSEAQITPLLDQWEAQIEAATLEAEQNHNDALTHAAWQNALNNLKAKLDFARK